MIEFSVIGFRKFRFLVGIGIGAEYPCGAVAASEQAEEEVHVKRARYRWLVLATSEYSIYPVHRLIPRS